ncbi:outer membrane protein [Ruegeria arenilitoris]|uniref:Autotransporter beta-domain protein n=1 Tax=Ruegeria arenilitoris TaxID=1173585 RepID=A0A238KP45_9RHOB|nr:outer membrane beta-barrel protein [Ruegeria arenilitoris]SMX44508.1 Autotransporter beta-domain protein [Ruegeria arenilitoris]
MLFPRLALLTVSTLTITTSAALAGSNLPTSPDAQVVSSAPAVFDWNGFYAGAQFGYLDTDVDLDVSPQFTARPDADGGELGIFAGYNWQPGGPWVYGIEAEYNSSNADGSDSQSFAPIANIDYDAEINSTAAIRGRVGFAADRTLLYLSAGWAYVDYDVEQKITGIVNSTGSGGGSEGGWTLGAGLEYAFSEQWVGRVDYRYSDFDGSTSLDGTKTDVDLSSHQIRFGIAMRF